MPRNRRSRKGSGPCIHKDMLHSIKLFESNILRVEALFHEKNILSVKADEYK